MKMVLKWYLNDKELTIKDNVKFEVDQKSSTYSLVIPKVQPFHSGTVTIKASNNVGEVEHSFDIDVQELPKFSGKLVNVTVSENQEAKFTIKISGGKPKPSVKWFKDDEEILPHISDIYEVVELEDTVSLIIKSAKPENAGTFFAQLFNDAGSVNTNKAQLIVQYLPIILKNPSDFISEVGDQASFDLIVENQMHPVKAIWYKNNKVVKSDDLKYKLLTNQQSHCLVIENLVSDDAGEIKAEVSNAF
ncbi:muscle M-line assembly unc-89-like, partial [Brachionus plicatilis]